MAALRSLRALYLRAVNQARQGECTIVSAGADGCGAVAASPQSSSRAAERRASIGAVSVIAINSVQPREDQMTQPELNSRKPFYRRRWFRITVMFLTMAYVLPHALIE
jgi:hypothetical protein